MTTDMKFPKLSPGDHVRMKKESLAMFPRWKGHTGLVVSVSLLAPQYVQVRRNDQKRKERWHAGHFVKLGDK